MTRLTKDLRQAIARNCVEVQFAKQKKEVRKEESDLGLELYKDVFDAKIISQAKKMPEKWLRKDSCLRFNCAGYDLRFNVEPSLSVPFSSDCSRLGSVTGELASKAQEFVARRDKLNESYRAAYNAVLALLDSVNSIAQLEKVWPDGKPFYARYVQSVQGTSVPAIQVKELNTLLGLAE